MNSIKELRPKKNGRYSQGYINASSCKKLFESCRTQPIIYRSSWEKKFIYWCEHSNKVKQWGSECVNISYYNPLDKKTHRYYPDFVVQLTDGSVLIVEIKPYNQTVKPVNENSWAMTTYCKNSAKWKALKEACDRKGYRFCILTEHTISKITA